VSWIVAPYITCEHPKATPGYGEALSSRLLSALASNPAVWAKTVFILNYDENDGFFDHVPPPVPPVVADRGKSTVGIAEEIYHGEPVGLGPRVPLLIISPWTRGGWVNSQLHDHTSVIRFLEARFGVAEPQISPWRRTVCGDLTSLFDFAQGDAAVYALAPADGAIATADASCKLQHPVVPQTQAIPQQETGQRPARPLPYDIRVSGTADETVFRIDIVNSGRAGATLTVYANDHSAGPWYYTVDAGKTLSDMLPLAGKEFGFSVYGPNGFLRAFHGASSSPKVVTSARYDATDGALVLKIANNADSEKTVAISALDYSPEPPRTLTIAAGATHEDRWNIASSAHWYDIAVKMPDDDTFLNRFAGHIETGKPSLSDPAFGRQRA
jgi:phospholipase C